MPKSISPRAGALDWLSAARCPPEPATPHEAEEVPSFMIPREKPSLPALAMAAAIAATLAAMAGATLWVCASVLSMALR